VGSHGEVAVADFREVVAAELAQGFGQVIDHEAVVVRKQVIPHLRDFPTRQVEMQAVDECHVISDHLRHRREQVARLHHDVDRLLGISKQRDAGVSGRGFLTALERS
jgi:hypothetical protein